MYTLQWKNPAITGKTAISVPVGSVVSNAASITFTGKGAANYGKVQQENLMRLLEHFADGTSPSNPTVGQLWYDTSAAVLKLCTGTVPLNWRSLAGVQVTNVGDATPISANLGDLWFERTGPISGNLYVYSGIGRFPLGTTLGGWAQVWPQVDNAALRDEYDVVLQSASYLFGDSTAFNGSGAAGRNLVLSDLASLDNDLVAKVNSNLDTNVLYGSLTALRTQPYSGDWDLLLAAIKWAVNRLDLPATMATDISDVPFVQDGRQVPSTLLNYPGNDIRFPSAERLANRRYGSVTTTRLFAETMNVLNAAVRNRFSLRGIAGTSGSFSSFGPDVVVQKFAERAGTFTGGTGTVNVTLNFASTAERDRFVYGGNAVEIVLTYSGSNTSFGTFINTYKKFRVTADKVRAINTAGALGDAPSTLGLSSIIAGGASTTTLTTRSGSGCSTTISGSMTGNSLSVNLTLSTPVLADGTTTVSYNLIRDTTVYGVSDTDLFPMPFAYNPGTDSAGTTPVFANVSFVSAPQANFSVSGTSGSTATSFTFTYTGTGSPSLVEWDFDGDGVFTATGTTATYTYPTSGKKTVRVRATNTSGQDALARVSYISIA